MTRRGEKQEPLSRGDQLTVTVCVSPLRRIGRNTVQRELEQVRSALLYADQVRLVSTTVAMLDTFRPLMGVSESHDVWRQLRQLPNATLARMYDKRPPKSVRKDLAKIESLPRHDPARTQLEAHLLPPLRAALDEARDLYDQALTPELDLARDRGALIVELENFELNDTSAEHIAWFRGRMLEAWSNPTGTVLLDKRAQRALRQHAPLERHPRAMLNRSKRAATGTGLVKRLPTFPDAPMGHVLEARDELTEARVNYRRVVRGLSEQLASTALDESLESDITELWHDTVAPALDEMTRTVNASRIAAATRTKLLGDLPRWVGSTSWIAAVVGSFTASPSAAALSASGAVASYVVETATREAIMQRRAAQSHDLAYLTQVNTVLRR